MHHPPSTITAITAALCALLVVSAAGCGASTEIADTPLAGTVAGQPLAFVAGETNAFLSEGESDYFAELYPSAYTACGFGAPDGPHLILSVPKEPGDYEFGLSLNMTFYADGNNLVATEGAIRVDEVTATTVTGGVHGIFDGDNEVDGVFSIPICPSTTVD